MTIAIIPGTRPEIIKVRSRHARGDQSGSGGFMVFPVHPRTREQAAEFGIEFDGIRDIEPSGSWSFCNRSVCP